MSFIRKLAGSRGPAPALLTRQIATAAANLTSVDVWAQIRAEALAKEDSASFSRHGMNRFLHTEVLRHDTMCSSLAHLIGAKYAANADSVDYVGGPDGSAVDYVGIISGAL